MKVTLTPAELTALVASHYNISATALTVEVGDDPDCHKATADKLVLAQYQSGHVTDFGDIRPDKKIAAIKLLREMVPGSGLAQAKYAIENWPRFILHVRNNGIPDFNANWSEQSWFKPL